MDINVASLVDAQTCNTEAYHVSGEKTDWSIRETFYGQITLLSDNFFLIFVQHLQQKLNTTNRQSSDKVQSDAVWENDIMKHSEHL